MQDDKGFIWFGTEAGLSRFDGVEFKNYSLKDGLPDMDILNFFKDSKGRIWFYTFNGRVGFLKDGKIYNSGNSDNLKNSDFKSRITSIVEADNYILISSLNDGIKIIFEKGVAESVEFNSSPTYLNLVDSTFYKINSEGNRFEISHKPVNEVNDKKVWPTTNIFTTEVAIPSLTYCHHYKNYIIGISSSLVRHFIVGFNTKDKSSLVKNIDSCRVYNLAVFNDELWLFSNVGILEFNVETSQCQKLIDIKETTNFTYDNKNNGWVSTLNSGVFFLPKKEVKKTFSPKRKVNCLSSSHDSTLYFIHSDIHVSNLSGDRVTDLFELPNKSGMFQGLYVDTSSNIWTLHSSSLRKNGEVVNDIRNGSSLSSIEDNSYIYQDYSQLEYNDLLSGEKWSLDFLKLGKIWDQIFISKYDLLIATSRGLFRANLTKSSLQPLDTFAWLQISGLSFDKYGYVWLASNGYGLMRIPLDSMYNLEKDQLLDFRVTSYSDIYKHLLLVDTILYATSAKGVSKFNFDSNEIKEVSHITEANGLDLSRINDLIYHAGKIYVAQDNGLFSFNHNQSFDEQIDFPVLIDEVVAGDSSYVVTDSMIFPYDVGSIQINSKTVYFRDHKNLTYQFRLFRNEAFDTNWTNSPNSEFIFSKLEPGKYTFQVRVKSTNSDWSDSQELKFEINNIFWKTLWFRVAVVLILIFMGLLIYRSLTKSKKLRRLLQREKIESDLKALKAQINPHFLFNSINSIQSFVLEGDIDFAEDYLVKYAKLIRTILNHSNELIVKIEEEVELIKLYVELENFRLERPIDFKILIDGVDAEHSKVPSMIIQPLIENAIWHGIQPSKRAGEMFLKFSRHENRIYVSVEDNGVGFEQLDQANHKPHGIKLVMDRIDLINRLHNVDSSFDFKTSDKGTKVTFSYPFDLN